MATTVTTYSPAELVSMAWARGETLSSSLTERTEDYFDDAMTRADLGATMAPSTLTHTVEVQEPSVAIPSEAEGSTLEVFDARSEAMIADLATRFSDFITTFFPSECDYMEKVQQWLCKVLGQGGTGLSSDVEAQIWSRDRTRLLRDAARQEDALVRGYAAKGFPLPPGAMLAAINRAREEVADRLAQASRDVAIKQAEMELDNIRFAITNAIGLRKTATDAAREYIATMAGTYQIAAQVIPSVTDSQSRLISAASDYYRARISVEDLRLRAATLNAENTQRANEKNLDAQVQGIRNKVDVAVEAAKALSTQAAAMLNALHVSSSTSASGSKGVSYSYSGEVSSEVPPQTS